ncbi:hypothetical protein AZE42_09564 [Rhizopogon vesiculosus]|uniref:Uncharacterized protein n=1 Tax=Rhizopogon vesiculosus TaxID=180088 RepID=A0A1J8PSM7_9AGAM|nr:hypothetical protein AZE42_09564 [Rhizopogon vesiculosus]
MNLRPGDYENVEESRRRKRKNSDVKRKERKLSRDVPQWLKEDNGPTCYGRSSFKQKYWHTDAFHKDDKVLERLHRDN